ncbi:hypothetical protein JXA12_02565 [Candidatus Woesearchaeota archaeon]|nr:hypothetical protein [Candidatus Woesearchaeota archaeon]
MQTRKKRVSGSLMRANKKQLPLFILLALAITAVAAPSASAEGCCLAYISDATVSVEGASCFEEGDTNAPSLQGKPVTQELCTSSAGLYGQWSTTSCVESGNIYLCQEGCCCKPNNEGFYTARFACISAETAGDEFVITFDHDCDSICAGSVVRFDLTVNVKDEDGNPVSEATVRVTEPGSWSFSPRTQSTDEQGKAVFTDLLAKRDYLVSASIEDCSSKGNPVNSEEDKELDITLDCGGTVTPPTCTPQYDCYYLVNGEKTYDSCGQYDVCEDINCDPPVTWTGPLPTSPCATGTCGNGVIEEGEACDTNDDRHGSPVFPAGFSVQCDDHGYDIPYLEITCTNCELDRSRCQDCPLSCTPEQCACTPEQCAHCDSCKQSGLCSTVREECLDAEIVIEPGVQSVTATPRLKLAWSYACSEDIVGYVVHRRLGTSSLNDPPQQSYASEVKDVLKGGTIEFQDPQALEPNTQYCYNVTLRVMLGDEVVQRSKEACGETGDAYCFQETPAEFCADESMVLEPSTYAPEGISHQEGDTWRAYCDLNNHIQLVNTNPLPYYCGQLDCIGPDSNGHTYCGDTALCRYCSGLFGMYSHLAQEDEGIRVTEVSENRNRDVDCYEYNARYSNNKYCYLFATRTVADAMDTCADVDTCYDYTDEYGCETNPCDVETADECEWHALLDDDDNSLSAQAGLGVCAPTDPAAADCGLCGDNNDLLPTCTPRACELYGAYENEVSSCYYAADEAKYGDAECCISREHMGCVDYTNKEDCTGDNELIIDVTYDRGRPANGTNAITQPSDDRYGFGVCEWSAEHDACIKNADFHSDDRGLSDCEEQGFNDRTCISDNKTPTTTVHLIDPDYQPWGLDKPVYGKDFSFIYAASDDNYQGEELDTYFSMSLHPNEHFYPDQEYDDIAREWPSGNYKLRYYTIDPARNMEVVQEQELVIDTTPPSISSITATKDSYNVTEDFWLTNLTITYQVMAEEHPPITCTNTLQRETNTADEVAPDRVVTLSQAETIKLHYPYLRDDDYVFNVTCKDGGALGNEQTFIISVSIEADASITNRIPNHKVFRSDDQIFLSVRSAWPAACYYSAEHDDPATRWNNNERNGITAFQASPDNLTHTSTVTGLSTGIYQYWVGCNFPDQKKITEGLLSDRLIFSVDDEPPTMNVTKANGEPYAVPADFAERVTLTLNCEDKHENLEQQGNPYDFNFGLSETSVKYCVTEGKNEPCTAYEEVAPGFTKTFSYESHNESKGQWLRYYCEDNGGNKMTENSLFLAIKDTTFAFPTIKVYTRSGEGRQAR